MASADSDIAVDMVDDLPTSTDMTDTFLVRSCLVCYDKVVNELSRPGQFTRDVCESCKGFFLHSLHKRIEYRCSNGGKCTVTRLNRNRCLHCRLKKCVDVTADIAVENNCKWQALSQNSGCVVRRFLNMIPEKILTNCSIVNNFANKLDTDVLEGKKLDVYNIILGVSIAYNTTRACGKYEVDKLSSLVVTLTPGDRLHIDSNEGQRCQMFQTLAALMTPSIKLLVNFAKHIPDFLLLSQDDQLFLIKFRFYEMWLLNTMWQFDFANETLHFNNGSSIPFPELDIVYTTDFFRTVASFIESCSMFHLNDAEVGLLTGLVLTASVHDSEIADPVDMQTLTNIYECLARALKLQLSRRHPENPPMFSQLMSKIPRLHKLGKMHNSQLAWFRSRWNCLHLSPLFAEIFDIPKMNTSSLLL